VKEHANSRWTVLPWASLSLKLVTIRH